MGVAWFCPGHQGHIGDYALLGKKTGRGRWALTIRCACGAVLVVSKHGIRFQGGENHLPHSGTDLTPPSSQRTGARATA
jgi:hypothetical protein